MCKSCRYEKAEKKIQNICDCLEEDWNCGIIEFDEEPKATPYCCSVPMKLIK